MTAKNTEGLDYKTILSDLEAKRIAIDETISGLKKLIGLGGADVSKVPSASHATEVKSDSFFGMNIVEATKTYLALASRTPRTTNEIVDALTKGGQGNPSYATTYSVLTRDARQGGGIVKVNKNDWGLAEWYPNVPRKRKGGKKSQNEDSDNKE